MCTCLCTELQDFSELFVCSHHIFLSLLGEALSPMALWSHALLQGGGGVAQLSGEGPRTTHRTAECRTDATMRRGAGVRGSPIPLSKERSRSCRLVMDAKIQWELLVSPSGCGYRLRRLPGRRMFLSEIDIAWFVHYQLVDPVALCLSAHRRARFFLLHGEAESLI